MKKLILILSMLPLFVVAQCPLKGDSPKAKLQSLDSLKNRPTMHEKQVPIAITAEEFLAMKPDPQNALAKSGKLNYFKLTTYMVGIKYAGSESCQCHSSDKANVDFHIETASTPNADETVFVICEVNRYNKVEHPELNMDRLKTFKGKKVVITGYYFYDTEHENAAENIKHRATNWRGTCSEIHSIFSIELAD